MSDLTIQQQNTLAFVIASVLPLRQECRPTLNAVSTVVAQMLADERERIAQEIEAERDQFIRVTRAASDDYACRVYADAARIAREAPDA